MALVALGASTASGAGQVLEPWRRRSAAGASTTEPRGVLADRDRSPARGAATVATPSTRLLHLWFHLEMMLGCFAIEPQRRTQIHALTPITGVQVGAAGDS